MQGRFPAERAQNGSGLWVFVSASFSKTIELITSSSTTSPGPADDNPQSITNICRRAHVRLAVQLSAK